ncbi:MAG: hypothetical protein ACYC4L_07035 [Chloroflexota bacterium]
MSARFVRFALLLLVGAAAVGVGAPGLSYVRPTATDPLAQLVSPAAAADLHRVYLPLVARDYRHLVPASRFGIWLGGGATQVGWAAGAGAGWTRVIIPWAAVETQPGSYDFSRYDADLLRLAKAQIKVIVEFRENPPWAASTFCGPIDQPGGLGAFAAFVGEAVSRYSAGPYNVKHWEFYNEPDGTDLALARSIGMGCWGDYPTLYAQMLAVASSAAKSADPQAKIVLGGLAHENPPTHFRLDFLDRVLAAGGGAHFDFANVHFFSSFASLWSGYGVDITGKVARIRAIMAAHGVSKPIMVTEASWTDDGNLENQARYLPKVLARALAADVYVTLWFLLADWESADRPYYGLLNVNLQPKPAYTAYQVAVEAFGQATGARALSPGEVGVGGGLEGYAATVAGRERWMLWATPEQGELWVSVPARARDAWDKLGRPLPLQAGADTRILLDGSPIYVWY